MTKDDFQSIVIERLQKIEEYVSKLNNEVKSLKSQQKKLSSKFDDIEIQGFHDQIQALDKNIDELLIAILITQRVLAHFYIDENQSHMVRVAQEQQMNPKVIETIIVEQAKAKQKAEISNEPLEVTGEFAKFCKSYSKQMGIEAFRDY